MKKTAGIVNCPMHPTNNGDYFPTSRCPDCRFYQQESYKKAKKRIKKKNDYL